jgi:5'-3' exonuclease
MGVFQFYSWFRKQFPKDIYKLNKSINQELNLEIDNLMIDMNGLFHTSAQKVFKYGNYKPPYKVEIFDNNKTQQQVFRDICQNLENILMTVNPNKRVILCVDGPAPIAKQVQQRKRRYKSSLEREDNDKSFDSNCISPGTLFMDNLSKYIDWFIRSRLSENPLWQNLEIIYSSSSVPGEGEQKLLMYIRKYGRNNESFVIHGLDADLIMLSLLTQFPKFYILRDDTFDYKNIFL